MKLERILTVLIVGVVCAQFGAAEGSGTELNGRKESRGLKNLQNPV